MACNWLMMTSSGEDNWPSVGVWVCSLTKLKKKQEDLLDLITALLKFNCFFSTIVATQCTFFYNPAFVMYNFQNVITHAAVAQWSRRLPPNREVVSSNPIGDYPFTFFNFFVCLLTDIQKTFTETERLRFRYVKEHLPKQCLLSDEISY